jgi:hypothetical protein
MSIISRGDYGHIEVLRRRNSAMVNSHIFLTYPAVT